MQENQEIKNNIKVYFYIFQVLKDGVKLQGFYARKINQYIYNQRTKITGIIMGLHVQFKCIMIVLSLLRTVILILGNYVEQIRKV
jgi:hypothetical protein